MWLLASNSASGGTVLRAFAAQHKPALAATAIRHNLLLAIIEAGAAETRAWSLGAPGHCAMQSPGRAIVLGDLDRSECFRLAQMTVATDYPGVIGPDRTAAWFVERAADLGHDFGAPMPQMIHALEGRPRYPGVAGAARASNPDDMQLLLAWIEAFQRDARLPDPPPDFDRQRRRIAEGQYVLWIVDEKPVSMAAITRRTQHAAGIAAVYTPPALRARGYAGSVVASTVELAQREGKKVACLYTDLRNPASNRCYAKIGFVPVCPSWHFPRIDAPFGR